MRDPNENAFCSTQLCCEDDNSTVGLTSIEDDVARSQATLLMWTSYGIVVPIILTIGVFGNAAILVVLSGPVFRGIAYLYLSGLALAHIGVVLSWITISLYNPISTMCTAEKKTNLIEENRETVASRFKQMNRINLADRDDT